MESWKYLLVLLEWRSGNWRRHDRAAPVNCTFPEISSLTMGCRGGNLLGALLDPWRVCQSVRYRLPVFGLRGAGLCSQSYYDPERKLLYASAAEAGTLTVAEVGDQGQLYLKLTSPTVKGARGVLAAHGGRVYLIDPLGGHILKLKRK